MVEFIRSKRTSFVNKPVGVVAADTGARQLGLSVAEFGNSMQKIFWAEAKKEAIEGDVKKANTLAIRDDKGKLKFEKPEVTAVGQAKFDQILSTRYANDILIRSKAKFGELHGEYTSGGKFDKQGFDLAAREYIKGHIESFKENDMADFIPAFLSKVQNQAVLHSNKILNDKIAQENRIANENEKIIIDEEIQELEGLYYNQNSISISGVDAEETRIDLREDIAEAEKEILARIESLKGKPNGLAAPAIKELKRKMRINSSLGVLQSIIDKNPTDGKAIKFLELAFQGKTISPEAKSYLFLTDNAITESDLNTAAALKDSFQYTYSDKQTITGILSNQSGDATKAMGSVANIAKGKMASSKMKSTGYHTNSKPSREEYQLGLENDHGTLDIRSFMMQPQDKYTAILSDLRNSTILPQSLYEAFSNNNIMSVFDNLPREQRKTIAAKLLDTWNNISKRQGENMVSFRYPNEYNNIEKRFAIIKKIVDVGGEDYLLRAFDIANQSPESKENSDKLLMQYNLDFDLKATTASDVPLAILTKTDIDAQFHQEFVPFVKALLHAGKLKDEDGKKVDFSIDNIVEVLDNTYGNLFQDDGDETFQLFGSKIGGKTNVSYKNYYKTQESQTFFTNYVNNKLATNRSYDAMPPEFKETATVVQADEFRAGEGGNAKYLPSYQNAGGADMIWTMVDEDRVPIKAFDGTNITINTKDVNKALITYYKELEKIALAKNYDSATMTKNDIDTVLKTIDIQKNNFIAIKNLREQYGGMNKQIDDKFESLGDVGVSELDRRTDEDFDQTMIVPKENLYTKGLNYLLDLFESRDININIDGIRRDFPELGSKGSQNPAWQFVYNNIIREQEKEKNPLVKKALQENFDEDVAINIVDDVVEVIEYLGDIEGYKEHGYEDGVGSNATISIGAGFNIKFLTDDDLAILSADGRAKVKDLQKMLSGVPSGKFTLKQIEEYSKTQGIVVTEEQSQKIFRNKVTKLYKQFTTEFPNFTTLSASRQSALIDHAYQMGYGEGKFKKYWSEVSRGLKTNDAKRRDYHFMMAGSHLIYNFNTESQEAMSNLFVTGETILNKQFQNYGLFGNDRIYDRAELLGYISDNRPSAMDKSGTATRKIGSYIQRKTKDLIN
jgi:hypothetical protein